MNEHVIRLRFRRWSDTPAGPRWRASCACGWLSDPIHPDDLDAVWQARSAGRAHQIIVAHPEGTIEQALQRWTRHQ